MSSGELTGFEYHWDMIAQIQDKIIMSFICAFISMFVTFYIIKLAIDLAYSWRLSNKAGEPSSVIHYIEMKESQKYLYASYYLSNVYSVLICIGVYFAMRACKPPADKVDPSDMFLGNTAFRNDYCKYNMNE